MTPPIKPPVDEQQERINHCWRVVRSLHPCQCGYDPVRIEPCEINCDNCGQFVATLNWDESAHQWNEANPKGESPEVEGWV